jgi:drug/metabolite transporter (DMT)-like permease
MLAPSLALIFNAFVWGVSWWPLRALAQQGLHPLWATAIVFVFSLMGLLCARPHAWRGWVKTPWLWGLALASGLTNVGFNWAVTQGDVVRAVLLFYLMPAWVMLLAWPLLGERPNRASLLRLALALMGLVLVLKTADSPWPVPEGLTDWLAIMGGFCFALTNILLRKLHQTPEPTRILAMFAGGVIAATVAAFTGMGLGVLSAPPAPAPGWVLIAVLLSLAFLAGNLALQYGAARLSASTTSLIMLTEVLFASVSAVLLGAGELTAQTLGGGALILLAALWASLDFSKPDLGQA